VDLGDDRLDLLHERGLARIQEVEVVRLADCLGDRLDDLGRALAAVGEVRADRGPDPWARPPRVGPPGATPRRPAAINLARVNPDARAPYAAALTAIERRKAVRGLGLRTWKWDAQVEQAARAAAEQMAAAGWKAELSQLPAHASADVLAALRAADAADNQARARFAAWSALADQNRLANEHAAARLPAHFASTEATMGAFFAIAPAVVAADQADDALATLIKARLGR
jgi:hypothetical protein